MNEVTPAGAATTFATGLLEPEGLVFGLNGDLYIAAELRRSGAGDVHGPEDRHRQWVHVQRPAGNRRRRLRQHLRRQQRNGTVVKVTPAGVISNFASGFKHPAAWPPMACAFGPRQPLRRQRGREQGDMR